VLFAGDASDLNAPADRMAPGLFLEGVMDKILTLHPQAGKQGVRIETGKYSVIREAILDAVRTHGEISFEALTESVETRLQGSFNGSIPWYVITVKLDLEARGEIRRVPGSKPQRIVLAT
jgi:hypothetical protein